MQKLPFNFIIEYTIGDGCTWSSTVSRPIIATDKETFFAEAVVSISDAIRLRSYKFNVGGHTFDMIDFIDDMSCYDEATKWYDADKVADLFLYSVELLTPDEWLVREISRTDQ